MYLKINRYRNIKENDIPAHRSLEWNILEYNLSLILIGIYHK